MKKIDDYMRLNYRMEIIPDETEGGYTISFPELPGCVTCADSMEQVLTNAEDCKRAWLEAAIEDGIEIAEPISSNSYSGQFKLRIPKSLHRRLAEDAKNEGISMNQYCLYLLSRNSSAKI